MRPSIPRLSALLRKKPFPMPSPRPSIRPDTLIDEENSLVYDSKCFYPAKPGEVLGDRYQALVKVGWGATSTVWFARVLQGHIEEPEEVVALKIANNDATVSDHEREVEEHISTANPSHRGRSIMRTLSDSFEVKGPKGSHSCLVYPTMRESLSQYQRRFNNGKMPVSLIKPWVRALLIGLDYLHKDCRIVHTDLKLENIMVTIEDPIVLGDFMDSSLEDPMDFKADSTGRPVYQSRSDLGPLKSLGSIPQLTDFGMAMRLDEDDEYGIWPITPSHYRAPEVILGNGWQFPADIWSMGVLMWDMFEGKELFQHIHDEQGRYDAKLHIAEMIALLGPPPPAIIQRYQDMRGFLWPHSVTGDGDRLCQTAEEYFCGPFFDNNGRFLYEDLIPDRKLDDTVSFLEGEEREAFLDLAKGMVAWHPDWRKNAGELAKHPFLQPKKKSA